MGAVKIFSRRVLLGASQSPPGVSLRSSAPWCRQCALVRSWSGRVCFSASRRWSCSRCASVRPSPRSRRHPAMHRYQTVRDAHAHMHALLCTNDTRGRARAHPDDRIGRRQQSRAHCARDSLRDPSKEWPTTTAASSSSGGGGTRHSIGDSLLDRRECTRARLGTRVG